MALELEAEQPFWKLLPPYSMMTSQLNFCFVFLSLGLLSPRDPDVRDRRDDVRDEGDLSIKKQTDQQVLIKASCCSAAMHVIVVLLILLA